MLTQHFDLLPYNTFHLSATARYWAAASSVENLQQILQATPENVPVLPLGGGSNMLLTKAVVEALVVKIDIAGINKIAEDDDSVWIESGAGVVWHDLVLHCLHHDWGGIENLSLIPGTVGAAPIQNIGAYGVELKDVFDHLKAVRISDRSVHQFTANDCVFGYRESVFKNTLKGQFIITHVCLRLRKKHIYNTSYGAIQDTLKAMDLPLTIQNISHSVVHIRQSKLPNPVEIGNCGSFFKNPEITQAQYALLKEKHPAIVAFPAAQQGMIKLSAAWLIEQCGWKGKKIGDAGVYPHQALVLVNWGTATGNDMLHLAKAIQESVFEKFDVQIFPEVNII